MTKKWSYLAGSALFVGVLLALIVLQIRSKCVRPALYWATIVASTAAGTAMEDFAARSVRMGLASGATRSWRR